MRSGVGRTGWMIVMILAVVVGYFIAGELGRSFQNAKAYGESRARNM